MTEACSPSICGQLAPQPLHDLGLGGFALVRFVHPHEHDARVDLTALLDIEGREARADLGLREHDALHLLHLAVHRLERDADRRFGHDHERRHVLGGGELGADEGRQPETGDNDHSRHHERDDLVAQDPVEGPGVGGLEPLETVLEDVVEPTVLGLHLQDPRAQHRGQGQGDKERDEDCRGRDRDAELEEELADHSLHVGDRDEDRGDRKGRGHGREGDLLGPVEGGGEGVLALLLVAEDVLENDDGVVDHHTHRKRQRQGREVVERKAESRMKPKVAISEVGMASETMKVERHERRKTKTTRIARTAP